ncbi:MULTISPECIES: hypothetical protein [unclassified Stenotrophomonas]|uniref:hypothetical protein n=1 Tax=unclassified Stenotrophomonas TaxID=196198 RepID=UPI00190ADA5E|nr:MULTISPECIES: hypothetical protein [unclassified Stenotrophomonas]MBK0053296.1 hypothetical protein [Stenotrophomonas sp. S39]MDI9273789.1 hypothetical protein [Stenotrophomonas sp. PFBMAA-4]
MRKTLICTGLLLAMCAGSAIAKEVPRIDASSDEAASSSFAAMIDALPPAEQAVLAVAMLKLNMRGVKSAYDLVGKPDPSIVPIKDDVNGMTAAEIIALARDANDVKIAEITLTAD